MNRTRNLLLTVLGTTATKREARQFLTRYALPSASTPKRVSIIRASGSRNHAALTAGLARTCASMMDLGAHPVIVIDGSQEIEDYLGGRGRFRSYEQLLGGHADRFAGLLERQGSPAVALENAFDNSVAEGLSIPLSTVSQPISLGQIPVLLPLVYDRDTVDTRLYDSFKAVKALARALTESPDYELDKIIFVDPIGGLPSQRRKHAAHVLVNLVQEFGDISAELHALNGDPDRDGHLANLNAMQDILGHLPANASGIITTPQAAGAVLERNPIIYNILTDRPLISPSLPIELHRTQLSTSVLRKGMPVDVLYSEEGLDLRKQAKVGRVNLEKLQRLINRSFGRQLDLDHYLGRLGSNVASVVIVGDYDGAAIISWETSPVTGRRIPYLDKFAVEPTSQGALGVADIMLIQMIRRLFPRELIWRSRQNNPVNKWYFERARGHLLIPDSQWTMFWISDDPEPPLDEYLSVCSSIVPSLK